MDQRLGRAFLLFVIATGCHGRDPVPSTPAPVDPADANCATPRPDPAAACVQDCGPPVVRADDPPPAWQWLSPEEVASRAQHGCPRCLPADALISTPTGEVAVDRLVAGALVWSRDAAGRKIAVPVVRVGSLPTAPAHELRVVDLADGRTVTGSAGHPTADGRVLADLMPGDRLDGALVVAVRRRPYGGERTYDLLPASPTRAYWADGVALTSTLH